MFWGAALRQKSVSVRAMEGSTPLGKSEGRKGSFYVLNWKQPPRFPGPMLFIRRCEQACNLSLNL